MQNAALAAGILTALGATACIGLEKRSQAPSPAFVGKTFSIVLLQAPEGVSFHLDHLHRLIWQWRDGSPWFKEQMLGVSTNVPAPGSLSTILPAVEESLKSRSDLLVILHPRAFRWLEKGVSGASSISGGPLLDEAEFLVSIADLKQVKEIGTFHVRVARRSDGDTPIVEKLAYEIAMKAGFGWRSLD